MEILFTLCNKQRLPHMHTEHRPINQPLESIAEVGGWLSVSSLTSFRSGYQEHWRIHKRPYSLFDFRLRSCMTPRPIVHVGSLVHTWGAVIINACIERQAQGSSSSINTSTRCTSLLASTRSRICTQQHTYGLPCPIGIHEGSLNLVFPILGFHEVTWGQGGHAGH